MCGHALVVQYASIEQKVKKCKLLVTQLPAKIEMDYLKLLLEKVIGTDEFSLEQQDSTSVMVIFQQMLPGNGTSAVHVVCIVVCTLYMYLNAILYTRVKIHHHKD